MEEQVKKTSVQYRKDEAQKKYEKDNFIDPLKNMIPKSESGRERAIKLPMYIVFQVTEQKQLIIDIQEQPATNCKGESTQINATCGNMQTDNAAFEGWAVCLKAWFPSRIQKVILRWDIPSKEKKNPHYRRFLFRAWRFEQLYDWFTIDEYDRGEIIEFARNYNNLKINSSNSDPEQKGNLENRTEYFFVKESHLARQFKDYYKTNNFDHQLHVGIKRGNEQFFTGGQSAIDLWGRKDSTLTIIELKCHNIMVGIISELFLYICVTISLAKGEISTPNTCALEHESLLFANIRRVNTFHAEMLADEFHPLLENEAVLSILNDNLSVNGGVKLHFGKTLFSFDEDTKKLIIR